MADDPNKKHNDGWFVSTQPHEYQYFFDCEDGIAIVKSQARTATVEMKLRWQRRDTSRFSLTPYHAPIVSYWRNGRHETVRLIAE